MDKPGFSMVQVALLKMVCSSLMTSHCGLPLAARVAITPFISKTYQGERGGDVAAKYRCEP
jgi:hypothetical protein